MYMHRVSSRRVKTNPVLRNQKKKAGWQEESKKCVRVLSQAPTPFPTSGVTKHLTGGGSVGDSPAHHTHTTLSM